MAERLHELRNSAKLSYKVDETVLQELTEIQEQWSGYIPDAFSDDFLAPRFLPLPDAPEIELPPDPVSEEDQQAVLAAATAALESGEVYAMNTPEQMLAENAMGPKADYFGGAKMDLSQEESQVAEAIHDARRAGYGNLDVRQRVSFFNGDDRWRHSGPDEEL